MKGQFIVFEGIEGGGKSSQMAKTAQWLSQGGLGKPVEVLQTREPGGTELGQKLRSLLLSDHSLDLNYRSELLLYAADRAQHVKEVLKPALEEGKIILCDRYIHSTTAYQGYGRGLDLKLIQQLNAIASDGLESDLTLWLDVAIETGLERVKKRGKRDRLEKADIAFHQRVRQGYEDLANQFPQQILRIDANQNEPAVQSQIQTQLKRLVISH
ncbi:dTMP kinase [Euhalothece natronophila Z-M001]|uniref:Thymidylate kinase n=1 Tax=Euhalothece natronophila Z-M001 TaxID=522448 RepID=A0A5B8NP38_9CHRO|nr:dTMP kinase [Euhalothece natronophila]QDZ39949.1 dTMP kinase [Euhalothece natronophila Z-M001]